MLAYFYAQRNVQGYACTLALAYFVDTACHYYASVLGYVYAAAYLFCFCVHTALDRRDHCVHNVHSCYYRASSLTVRLVTANGS